MSELDKKKVYRHILDQIKLPAVVPLPNDQKLYEDFPKNDDIEPGLQHSMREVYDRLSVNFQIYDNPKHFKFHFPESKFPPVQPGERNLITYEQKIIREEQNTFKDKLSGEQIEQIKVKGEFQVKSNIEYITLPYVWKINETLFWGKQKISLFWRTGLSTIFGLGYKAWKGLSQSMPKHLCILLTFPVSLFGIIFGKKTLQQAVTLDYDRQIQKEFWMKVMQQFYKEGGPQWGSDLWKYLYVNFNSEMYETQGIQYNSPQYKRKAKMQEDYQKECNELSQRRNKLYAVHSQFQTNWGKLRKRVFAQCSQQITEQNKGNENSKDLSDQSFMLAGPSEKVSNDDKILQLLAERRFTLYLDHLKENLPKKDVPLDVVKAIVFLLELFKVIESKHSKMRNTIAKRQQQVRNKLKTNMPIKSLYSPYFDQVYRAEIAPVRKGIEQQFYQSLRKDNEYTSKLTERQLSVYKEFINFRRNHDTLIEAAKQRYPILYQPQRIFYSDYLLIPPYKVIKEGTYYSLKKKSDKLQVSTASHFWKAKLYWMRIKTWTINCLVFLVYQVWKGPFGFRCLFGAADFQYDSYINSSTGQISHETRKTVIGNFMKVCDGITLSRTNFQAQPDLGLFGKNFARLCNYIQCYFFRFFIVGVIITLVLYPIAIIVVSSLVTAGFLTFWVWMPVILLVTYLFNIFVFQFQSCYNSQGWHLSFKVAPVFNLIISMLREILIILLRLLSFFLFFPIASVFVFLFYLLGFVYRSITDKIMICLISCLGRTPSRDTAIARKISGPGMSTSYYMSITQQDVYVLTQANLQKLYVRQFHNQLSSKLNELNTKFLNTMAFFFKPYNSSYYNGNSPIQRNYNDLYSNYNQQYSNYMARYPSNPSRIRFTQQQIDSYFDNCVNIVKNFVQKHQMEGWIFEQYQLYQGMYEDLTKSIWNEMFCCGEEIFQPLEKLDQRFKLEDQYANDYEASINVSMKRNVNSIMKAMEGEVQLHQRQEKLGTFKHNLLSREIVVELLPKLYNMYQSNSKGNIHLNKDDVRTMHIPNLNIKEAERYSNYQRLNQIQGNPRIIRD